MKIHTQSKLDAVLDIECPEQLLAYLRETGRIDSQEKLSFSILAGGVSNRTVLINRPSGESWVIKQALEKLRVREDWFSSPLRIHRETMGLRWLEKNAPKGSITPFIFEDPHDHLLAMAAVPQPNDDWKSLLLTGKIDSNHVEQFGVLLGNIHRKGYEHQKEVSEIFKDVSFFESLRIEPYYEYTARKVPEAQIFFKKIIEDTRSHRFTVVHGDYSPKNILIYQGKLVLLDHEVIHFGDGAFDVGFSMTHLLSKAHHRIQQKLEFAKAAAHYWNSYQKTIGNVSWATELEDRSVCHTLACLLARVEGRSPLEYLTPSERKNQKEIVLKLMAQIPRSIPELIEKFVEALR